MKKQQIDFSCLAKGVAQVISDVVGAYEAYEAFYGAMLANFGALQKQINESNSKLIGFCSNNPSEMIDEAQFLAAVGSQVAESFLSRERFRDMMAEIAAAKEAYAKEAGACRDEANACRKDMKHSLMDFQAFALRMQKGQTQNPNFNAKLMEYYESHLRNVQRANRCVDTLIGKSEEAIRFLNDKLRSVAKMIQMRIEDEEEGGAKKRKKHKEKKLHTMQSIKGLREKMEEQFRFERILKMYLYPLFPAVIQQKLAAGNQQNQAVRVNFFELSGQVPVRTNERRISLIAR